MLIYSRKNSDGKLVLFGTTANIPDFENDKEVVYKDASGAEITIAEGDIYVDISKDFQQIKRLSDDAVVDVYISDADGSLVKVIGEPEEVVSGETEEEVVEVETPNGEEVVTPEASTEEVAE